MTNGDRVRILHISQFSKKYQGALGTIVKVCLSDLFLVKTDNGKIFTFWENEIEKVV